MRTLGATISATMQKQKNAQFHTTGIKLKWKQRIKFRIREIEDRQWIKKVKGRKGQKGVHTNQCQRFAQKFKGSILWKKLNKILSYDSDNSLKKLKELIYSID